MHTRRRFLARALAGTLAGALALPASAPAAPARETFPSRTLRLICSSPPGAPLDVISRRLAESLSRQLGVAVVVENKPGAAGVLAAAEVARATDGHTFLVTTNSPFITALAVMKSLPYDPQADFALISKIGASPTVLVANPKFGPDSLAELVALLKPGKANVTYGSWGPGTMPAQVMESLARKAGVALTEVPYRGSPPALQDVLANEVDMTFLSPQVALPLIEQGRIKPLAVVGGGRAALLPGVPTFAQAGYDDFVFGNPTWAGIAAPARMPHAALARMAQAIGVSVQDADMKEFLVSIGFEAIGNTPQAFEEEYRAERAALLPLLEALGMMAR